MFSRSYACARQRFLQASDTAGATILSYCVDATDDLTVDVALVGPEECDRVLLVTSGLHGVEGFFGSAVQLALLNRLRRNTEVNTEGKGVKLVLVHALNPFGFKHLRRFDQNNVDLNRNFLSADDAYTGAPEGYAELNRFLNPQSPPSRFEPYLMKALWTICKHGSPALKASIVSGQYEYPEGLFFGGSKPSRAAEIVRHNCDRWIGGAEVIAHIDLHSGLGAFGSYKLLLNEDHTAEQYRWYTDTFGEQNIEPLAAPKGTAYHVSGSLGSWLQSYYSTRKYYFAGAEFGTYRATRVLGAIRAENRAHYFSDKQHSSYATAKAELLECFCPRSEVWRNKVVNSSLDIISAAIKAIEK